MPTTAGVTYSEISIHPDLARYVQLIWMLDVDDAVTFGHAERILPDGIVEAVFHYREPFAMRYRGASFDRQPTSLVVSQTRTFIEIAPSGPGGFVSVRFYPMECTALLRRSSEHVRRSVGDRCGSLGTRG